MRASHNWRVHDTYLIDNTVPLSDLQHGFEAVRMSGSRRHKEGRVAVHVPLQRTQLDQFRDKVQEIGLHRWPALCYPLVSSGMRSARPRRAATCRAVLPLSSTASTKYQLFPLTMTSTIDRIISGTAASDPTASCSGVMPNLTATRRAIAHQLPLVLQHGCDFNN